MSPAVKSEAHEAVKTGARCARRLGACGACHGCTPCALALQLRVPSAPGNIYSSSVAPGAANLPPLVYFSQSPVRGERPAGAVGTARRVQREHSQQVSERMDRGPGRATPE